MAIYHFSAKVISRANGSSAVASAAYRAAERLHDDRLGRDHDFSNKAGVVHSEILAPEGAPERLNDRATLWNEVEAGEKRKDAQLAREVEFSIPRELNQQQGIQLARDFVEKQFVERGMVADMNVHWDMGKDGQPKPHAHVMLSMREVGPEGFGQKVREWNSTALLQEWRVAWADHVNERLAELDIDARIDHRTLEAQGIDLEPQHKIGPAASRMPEQGLEAERVEDHARIARENGEKIIARPEIALDAIARQQATFTRRDLAQFAFRHSDGKDQFDQVMSAVRSSPELVALGRDGKGEDRFTSRDMIAAEQRLERAAEGLAIDRGHGVADAHVTRALASAEGRGLDLSAEQRGALAHITGDKGLASVVGYAGSGKSAMLGVAREAWEAQGYQVRGAALSGIAAENLEGGSALASRTHAGMENQWGNGRGAGCSSDLVTRALASAEGRGLDLSAEQRGALAHITGDKGLASVVGYAGSGKSAMLGVAREAWEAQGYQVRGAALSGIAAENLEGGSAIASRTIASMEYQWEQGRELLGTRDVLVIDEAGMIGQRQLDCVLSHAEQAGAKGALVGDPEQIQGIEGENLEGGSAIASRTIASMEYQWEQGRELLGPRDVLVIDEAGMIGTRQMECVLSHAEQAGAKVVLVGDPEQLQAIEAGAAFRAVTERHGWAEITEIRRQCEDWQRDATKALATGRAGEAIHAYEAHGMVQAAETRELARADLVDRWDAERIAAPDQSRRSEEHTSEPPSLMRYTYWPPLSRRDALPVSGRGGRSGP